MSMTVSTKLYSYNVCDVNDLVLNYTATIYRASHKNLSDAFEVNYLKCFHFMLTWIQG